MEEEKNKNNKTESIKKQKADIIDELSENIIADLKSMPEGSRGLVVLKGPNIGEKFLIEGPAFHIDRSPESDILLDDVTVSRRHAMLEKMAGEYRIIDTGSLNGIYVNGDIVEKAILKNGDRIQIGKYIFLYFSIK
jgi:pSer/pThr/pTyr-binding forkhead associated (FHA) protein